MVESLAIIIFSNCQQVPDPLSVSGPKNCPINLKGNISLLNCKAHITIHPIFICFYENTFRSEDNLKFLTQYYFMIFIFGLTLTGGTNFN